MSSAELTHYGVKGMKWGVRRAEKKAALNKPNAGYTAGQRNYDKKNFGKGGAKRINRRLNKGQDLKTARNNEVKFRRRVYYSAVAGIYAARYAPVAAHALKLAAGVAAQNIAVRAETNRGRANNAASMGLPRQGSSGPNYSKQRRNGAYNISSL